jgi:arylsulfatase A-like enzyme
MMVTGPGRKPGLEFSGNVVNYDSLPTFVDWAGGDPKTWQNFEGVSLADYMAGKEPEETFLNGNLYFHYPHYRSSVPHSAIVSGRFKVLHFYAEPDIPILIDLSQDLGEVSNIARQHPEAQPKLYDDLPTRAYGGAMRTSRLPFMRLA